MKMRRSEKVEATLTLEKKKPFNNFVTKPVAQKLN